MKTRHELVTEEQKRLPWGEGGPGLCGHALPASREHTAGIQQTGAGGCSLSPLCMRLFKGHIGSHFCRPGLPPEAFTTWPGAALQGWCFGSNTPVSVHQPWLFLAS